MSTFNVDRAKKFNELVSKSKYLQKDLNLFSDDDDSLYALYKQILLQREKIYKLYPFPFAKEFVDNGYETLNEIFSLSDKDILAIKGIGTKSLKTIRDFEKGKKA